MLILKLISALTISVVIYVIVVEIVTLNASSHSSIRTNKTYMSTKVYPEKELRSKPKTYHDMEEKLKGYERTFVERKVGPYNLLGLGLWSNLDDDNEKFHGSDKKKHKDGSEEEIGKKEGRRGGANEKGRFSRRDDSRPKSKYNRRDGSEERKRYKSRDNSERGRYVSKDYFRDNERHRRRDTSEDRGQYRRRDNNEDRGQFRRRDGFENRERYPRRDDFDRRDSYRRRDYPEEQGSRNYRRSYFDDRDRGDRRTYSEDRDRGDRRRYSEDRGRERDDRRERSGGNDRRGYAEGRGRFDRRENSGRDWGDRRGGGRSDRKDFHNDRRSRKDGDGPTEAYGDWRTDPLRPTGDMGNYWNKIRLYTNDPKTMKVIYEFFGVGDPNKKKLDNTTGAFSKEKYEKEKRRERFKKLKRHVRGLENEWKHYKGRVRELEKYKNYSFTPKRKIAEGFIESTTELGEESLNLEDLYNSDEE